MAHYQLVMVREIKYAPPVLKNFGEEYQGSNHFLTKEDEWRAKHEGKFLLSALEDTIKVWALGGSYEHTQVYGGCNVEGDIVLGGGNISVYNEEKNSFRVYSRSYDFGSLPNKVLEDYFSSFGYSVKADMVKGIKDSACQWFREHGIDI